MCEKCLETQIEREEQEVAYELGYRIIDLVTLTFYFGTDGRVSDASIIEH